MTMPLLAALLVAIAACWSKELALPGGDGDGVHGARGAFGILASPLAGVCCSQGCHWGAFAWRHLILADAYAVVMGNPLLAIGRGLGTLVRLLPGLASSALGGERGVFWLIGLGLLLTLAVVGALFARRQAQTGWDRRLMAEVPPSFGVLAAVTTVALAAIIVQTPLAHLSAPIADGSPFGTITFCVSTMRPGRVCGAGCGAAGAGCVAKGVVDGGASVCDCRWGMVAAARKVVRPVGAHGYPAIFGGGDGGCGSAGWR